MTDSLLELVNLTDKARQLVDVLSRGMEATALPGTGAHPRSAPAHPG